MKKITSVDINPVMFPLVSKTVARAILIICTTILLGSAYLSATERGIVPPLNSEEQNKTALQELLL